jgi:hypothetical protein
MDLGAFLRPGNGFSLTIAHESHEARGRLISRRGRPLWLAAEPQPAGRLLNLAVRLPGFHLEADGALTPAAGTSATVALLGQVRACRRLPGRGVYLLRLKLLGRIWP